MTTKHENLENITGKLDATQTTELENFAKKIAFSTVRKLDSLSATDMTRKLMFEFFDINKVKQVDEISTNADDLVSVATVSLLQSIRDNETDKMFASACSAVRKYIYEQGSRGAVKKIITDDNGNKKEVTVPRYKHTYITDIIAEGKDIIDSGIDVTKGIEQANTTVLQNDMLKTIYSSLTLSQKQVIRLKAKGLTNALIAQKMSISKQYVGKTLNVIRQKVLTLYPNAVVQFDITYSNNTQFITKKAKNCNVYNKGLTVYAI